MAMPRLPSKNISWLLALVFLDMFGVNLILPFLQDSWEEVGGDLPTWGKVQSIYTAAQIVGAALCGVMSDRYGRRAVLLLSMAGAGLSYGLMGVAESVQVFIASRITVGLVKQTMGVSRALVTDETSDAAGRSEALAQVSAAVFVGTMFGKYSGSKISSMYVYGVRANSALCVAVFIFDFCLVWFALPPDGKTVVSVDTSQPSPSAPTSPALEPAHSNGRRSSAAALIANTATVSVVVVCLLRALIQNAMLSMSEVYIMQKRFGLARDKVGTIGLVTGSLQFAISIGGVGTLARGFGEARVVLGTLLVLAGAFAVEANDISLGVFLALVMPTKAIANAVLDPCLSSLFLGALPTDGRGAALGAYDLLENVVKVIAPLLGSWAAERFGLISWNWVAVLGFLSIALLSAVLLAQRPAQLSTADVALTTPASQEASDADTRAFWVKTRFAVALALALMTWHHYNLQMSCSWCGLEREPCSVDSVVMVQGRNGLVVHVVKDRQELVLRWVDEGGHDIVPFSEACPSALSVPHFGPGSALREMAPGFRVRPGDPVSVGGRSGIVRQLLGRSTARVFWVNSGIESDVDLRAIEPALAPGPYRVPDAVSRREL